MNAKVKFWCRSCGVYSQEACPSIGHISEKLYRNASGKWLTYKEPRLVTAQPPASGRGALEWLPCDEKGNPK